MCGLTALISPGSRTFSAGVLQAMTRLIRHRGPDDEGYFLVNGAGTSACYSGEETPADLTNCPADYRPARHVALAAGVRVGLGHRRLSIVDLSAAGHQPMCDSTGRYWIAYNGEVYNHTELRAELEGCGYRFRSDSDTEVILHAWAEWGPACQQRFNGMWAFVIYDLQRKELFGSRDRFGIKPLYWHRTCDNGLAFASEIKQFTALPDWTARLDSQIALDYLHWGLTDHVPRTMFQGVEQVPPGHCFSLKVEHIDGRPLKTSPWYRLPTSACKLDDTQAANQFHDLLQDAVKLRLRADVPVGSCLSGGLDSSSIVCLIHNLLGADATATRQQVISSCSEHARFDEREYIQEVVQQTGVTLHTLFPRYEDVLDLLPELVWTQDMPFGSTSIFAQWSVFQTARAQSLTVMLDGQGADEQLAGYHDFFGAWFTELLIKFHWIKLAQEIRGTLAEHEYSCKYALKQMARHAPLPAGFKRLLRRGGGAQPAIREFLCDDSLTNAGASLAVSSARAYQDACTVRGKSLAQLQSTNLPALLRYEDRNSMAHSIESRVPFLDYRLVEFALALPGEQKLRRGVTKHVLRQAMSRVIPQKITDRKDKMGFVTPESLVFTGTQADQFAEHLQSAAESCPGLFDIEKMQTTFDDVKSGRRAYEASLWRAVNFGAWISRFGVQT